MPKAQKHAEAATGGVIGISQKFTEKHLCQSLFIKGETLTQAFSCEYLRNF